MGCRVRVGVSELLTSVGTYYILAFLLAMASEQKGLRYLYSRQIYV